MLSITQLGVPVAPHACARSIEEATAGTPGGLLAGHTGLAGDILERFAGVPKQAVVSDGRDEQVGVSVVVEVSDSGSHAIQRNRCLLYTSDAADE